MEDYCIKIKQEVEELKERNADKFKEIYKLKQQLEYKDEDIHCLEFERDFLIADQKALIQKYRIEYVDLIVARREYKQAEQQAKG